VYASPLPHTRYILRPSHFYLFYSPNNIGWGVQIIHHLLRQFPLLPSYRVPLRPKYSPKHPILKHPHPTFLPQYQQPSFTPIQNNVAWTIQSIISDKNVMNLSEVVDQR
jgi:hypothetical protein